MKKLTMLIAVIALATTGLAVQAGPGYGHGERGFASRDLGAMSFGPRLERFAEELGLSDAQLEAIEQIQEEAKSQGLREAMRANREALREAAEADPYDADAVAALAAEQGELVTQSILTMNQIHQEILAVLTEEQRVALAELKEQRHARRSERRARWREHHGG